MMAMKASDAREASELIRRRAAALDQLSALARGGIESIDVRVIASDSRAGSYIHLDEGECHTLLEAVRGVVQNRMAWLNARLKKLGVEPGA
jgi:hypothetical protein